MFDEYPRISEVLPASRRSRSHPLGKMAFDALYAQGHLEAVERALERLKAANLLTPRLTKRLRNRAEFYDTMAEIHTALRLLDCGLTPIWGDPRPDILLKEQGTEIEVKRLREGQKLADLFKEAKGEVVEVSDRIGIGRLKAKIDDEVLGALSEVCRSFVLVVQLAEGFDDLEDLFLDASNRDGLFFRPEYEKISAVVRMERAFLLQGEGGVVRPQAAEFEGISNPNRLFPVPDQVKVAFNIA